MNSFIQMILRDTLEFSPEFSFVHEMILNYDDYDDHWFHVRRQQGYACTAFQ